MPAAAAQRPLACAKGAPPTTRAHVATYAASQPLAAASTVASPGATRSTTAVTSPSPSRNAITGSASAFATTPSSGTRPNWSQSTGAVATLHAAETAIVPTTSGGTG